MSGHYVLMLSGHFYNLSGHACHSRPISFSPMRMRINQPRAVVMTEIDFRF